jgi:hypothetical protein
LQQRQGVPVAESMVVVAEAMNSKNYYILQPMAIGWAFYIRDSLMETAKKM